MSVDFDDEEYDFEYEDSDGDEELDEVEVTLENNYYTAKELRQKVRADASKAPVAPGRAAEECPRALGNGVADVVRPTNPRHPRRMVRARVALARIRRRRSSASGRCGTRRRRT